MRDRSPNSRAVITPLILLGIWILYVQQVSPAPLLGILAEHFGIANNDMLLNMSVSIIFPAIIVASLVGAAIEHRLGLRRLFTVALGFAVVGMLTNYVASSYWVFLLGRFLYGVGFGLAIPFIGSAIMKWYEPHQREGMNTANGLFPFFGAVTGYALMVPIYVLLGSSWRNALGAWGIVLAAVMIAWVTMARDPGLARDVEPETEGLPERGTFFALLRRRSIRLLSVTFICDFLCYSYIATILPTYLSEIGGLSATAAGLWAALAFPAVGILGGMLGGIHMSRTGRRKPSLVAGQVLKLAGLLVASLGASVSFGAVVVGVVLFGLGNSCWMPALYNVPMDLEDMTPNRVGSAFALILAFGFAAGAVSPAIGGWLTTLLAGMSGLGDATASHIFGLKWSLFAFAFINIVGVLCMLAIRESGPAGARR